MDAFRSTAVASDGGGMIARVAAVAQAVGTVAVVVLGTRPLWGGASPPSIALGVAAVVALAGTAVVLWRQERARQEHRELLSRVAEGATLANTLEQTVLMRSAELEDAQRALQRMWWLGQNITLELNIQWVFDRFLEAVMDVVRADGGFVAVRRDDGRFHITAAAGTTAGLVGHTVPLSGSKLGVVIRGGQSWTATDILAHREDLDAATADRIGSGMRGVAMIPITRRSERIGVVVLGTTAPHAFTPPDLERTSAMADLLAVTLENAELVETLRQAEWRFRTLFRAAPDAVLTVLRSGRIREANDAVREITGRDAVQIVGRALVELVTAPDQERIREALEAAFEGKPQRLEIAFDREGQGSRAVALAMTRLPEADPPSVLLIGRDITAEREMRGRLMESDRLAALGELVAGVAHEVNNPLSSISAFAQILLRDGGLTATQRDSVEVIKGETLRASQVVRDLLAFARRSESRYEPVDLSSIVAHTLRLRGFQLSTNRITVDQWFDPALPAVMGDARQLQQVCLNLVTNAIQAMATLGGGTLFVTTRADGNRVVVEMRDTGPGIPEPARAHVFEPFFTTKGEGEGTGLGLSVSYGIVTEHGGTIAVVDTSAAGTTFRVSLPVATIQPAAEGRTESRPSVTRSRLAGTRILFIDDEPALRTGMQTYGRLRGFTVLTASDGNEGLTTVRTTGVDAVVCDLRMPGMDGFSFHERLARERPGLAARTVFITGDVASQPGLIPRQPVVMKPFAFERLEEALVAVMRGAPFRGVATPRATPSHGTERGDEET